MINGSVADCNIKFDMKVYCSSIGSFHFILRIMTQNQFNRELRHRLLRIYLRPIDRSPQNCAGQPKTESYLSASQVCHPLVIHRKFASDVNFIVERNTKRHRITLKHSGKNLSKIRNSMSHV